MTTSTTSRRELLTRAGVELLEDSGPDALSTRKVATRAGTTTMAVYTEFGSISGLIASIVDHGFGLLNDALAAIPSTDDPVADLHRVSDQYRAFALAHPHLYRVMYAVGPVGGYVRNGPELLQGAPAFGVHLRAVRRAVDDRPDAFDLAVQIWASVHGVVLIELSGFLASIEAQNPPDVLHSVVDGLVGATLSRHPVR
ncbi:TetR/AcrR family transcriptional regulator [Gordonia sp. L191]|uniref:TetR/AcrR family transcriptional regulator n=1 Tax=Gordonia sp. L191 TaxID=2982699 RepID=UPI0024C0274D|nr:TetR/AcrR family transcriptional regulator [Gordonia sp. L191]WHU45774.1 TetR/AcrR family transcriptional regulator [Gordonia sp. L191]